MKQNSAINLGDKIKDIEINQKNYKWMILSLLVLFNAFLIWGFVYVCTSIPKWYVYFACFVVWIVCVAESLRVFIKAKRAYKYEVFDNCMMINTLYTKYVIKFEDVFMVKTEKSILDRLAMNNTKTLIIHVKDSVRNIVKLPFVSEDVKMLTQTIMQRAIKCREN